MLPSTAPVTLSIDGATVTVAAGETLLVAARHAGIEIPTLCFLECLPPATSCLVCLVKVVANGQSRLVPACATKAQPGMCVESETAEVHEARRTALELLLSDHAGDCLAPCHRICPLHLNIPLMIRCLQDHRIHEAIRTVRTALPLAGVLGRLCHRPCENGCRRGTHDSPAAIRDMERFAAEADLGQPDPFIPPRLAASGKRIAIVGAGPSGLTVAHELLRRGHECTLLTRGRAAGGSLRTLTADELPAVVLADEIGRLERLGAQFRYGESVRSGAALEGLAHTFDAVVLACGPIDPATGAELGLAMTATGARVNLQTGQTTLANVYAAGSAVRPIKQIVRAISEGQDLAERLHQVLAGQHVRPVEKPFSSMLGRLADHELRLFLEGAKAHDRVSPSACGACGGFDRTEARAEAGRCLHCDCRAAGNCRLQDYAERYRADASRYRQQRRAYEVYRQRGGVIFEPGKCILCGICVQLTERAREPLGLTFVGRGFEVRVAAPFESAIEAGLAHVAAECVRHCPTGALAFAEGLSGGTDAGAPGASCGSA